MTQRAPERWVSAILLVGVSVLVAGCFGQPSSTSDWQSKTDRALGALVSGLGTARVVLEEEAGDDLPHSYGVVTLTDAVESSSRELSTYLVVQPPDRLHGAHRSVTRALHEAMSLLVVVRVAVESPGVTTSSAQDLIRQIDSMRDRLDDLDSAVMASPGSVSAR